MNRYPHIRNIIWDWNGTLLNDLELCISSINLMLEKRGLSLLSTVRYKQIFTFPVRDYYLHAGFDLEKEDFTFTGLEFIELYRSKVREISVHEGTADILDYLAQKGYRQFIVSAMEHDFLTQTVAMHGISRYFGHIAGIDNHYAGSKLSQALGIMNEYEIQPSETLFIGDTLHDFEVANEAGAQSLLISHGHQSYERLLTSGARVINSLNELRRFL